MSWLYAIIFTVLLIFWPVILMALDELTGDKIVVGAAVTLYAAGFWVNVCCIRDTLESRK